MIAVVVGAVAVTALFCMVAAIFIGKTGPEGRHAAAKPPPGIRIKAKVNSLLARDDFSTDDHETELWIDGLAVRKQHGPPAPARRPQALTVARVRVAAIIRAVPLDAVPWLKHGHGYSDSTGGFEALTAPPALHAHESASMTRADLADGLAKHAKEWGP